MSSTAPSRSGGIQGFLKRRWLSILLVILAGVFIAQNRDRVSIDLFLVKLTAPLWLVLLILFVAGLVAGLTTFRRRAARASSSG